MGTAFEIHPSIGIARVGTSVRLFVGPEPDSEPPNRYRDGAGELLRQAARFRVFECERDDNHVLLDCREVTPDRGTVEWTVHLANTTAAGRSDHTSFQERGFPAILVSENLFAGAVGQPDGSINNPNYHSAADTTIDAEYTTAIARAAALSAWTLANV